MQTNPYFNRLISGRNKAFTLVELLAVMGVMVVIMAFSVPLYNSINGAASVTKSASDIAGALEMAKSYAIAHNTYVWVGFFEEDPSTPGKQGTGRVVISVVASNDGTNQLANAAQLTTGNSTQVYKLIKLDNTHLASASNPDALTGLIRTSGTTPPATGQIGDSSFNSTKTVFNYPLSGSGQYQFRKVIQYSPLGDATRFNGNTSDTPVQYMEVGIRPAHGNQSANNSNDIAAIQIAGIGGVATIQRP